MQIASQTIVLEQQEENQLTQFQHLISIKPLGFLYGSAGRFLSPDNLVGRSGTSFPPHAATVAGLIAAASQEKKANIQALQVAGPFWSWEHTPQYFYVPTPFNYLIEDKKISHILSWHEGKWQAFNGSEWREPPDGKFESNTWMSIQHWPSFNTMPNQMIGIPVEESPWKINAHLHPRLGCQERCVDIESDEGSLFLENAVELNPDACLVYLCNQKPSEEDKKHWYRFGGEGHLVEVDIHSLNGEIQTLLDKPLNQNFALVTPGLWGSNRLSQRWPSAWGDLDSIKILTQRPIPYRYRLQKALSRGRYAVPAGTVYRTDLPFPSWQNWKKDWFPCEGISLKHFGCGLALPLPDYLAAAGALP
jgi:CRISPR-associated protein Cmr3